jgi:hypothetical protein
MLRGGRSAAVDVVGALAPGADDGAAGTVMVAADAVTGTGELTSLDDVLIDVGGVVVFTLAPPLRPARPPHVKTATPTTARVRLCMPAPR